jgi:hypothetical protein
MIIKEEYWGFYIRRKIIKVEEEEEEEITSFQPHQTD